MSKFNASHGANMTVSDLAAAYAGTTFTQTATTWVVNGAGGVVYTFTGTFTGYDVNGRPTGGTVTAMSVHFSGFFPPDYSYTNFSLSVASLLGFLQTDDLAGFQAAVLAGN